MGVSLLILVLIIAAVIAVESRDLIRSVIALAIAGFLLCIIFMMLGARELALLQLVVEVLILTALIRVGSAEEAPAPYNGNRVFALLSLIMFILFFSFVSYAAFPGLPKFGSATGSIIYIFRGFDTLAASAAIFASVIGAMAILRPKGRKKTDEKDGISGG